ncbi:MAG: PLD nuclease N-terminal domain-containing protein [Candidatus Pelethousia sp.]|nr:PLD nuclease N-terminal domain-containing protein [Candidatus Pelethousia sp.]
MNEFALTKDMLLILSPLILLQISLAVYCSIKIFREGVQNLNIWAWFFICLFANVIGPVLFLLVGRKKEFK